MADDNKEKAIIEGWKRVCRAFKGITLSPEERELIKKMFEWEKRNRDPKNFKIFLGCGA